MSSGLFALLDDIVAIAKVAAASLDDAAAQAVAAGKKTLAESGLKIESAGTMADAAQKIVKLVA